MPATGRVVVEVDRNRWLCHAADVGPRGLGLWSPVRLRQGQRVGVVGSVAGAPIRIETTVVRCVRRDGGYHCGVLLPTPADADTARIAQLVSRSRRESASMLQVRPYVAAMTGVIEVAPLRFEPPAGEPHLGSRLAAWITGDTERVLIHEPAFGPVVVASLDFDDKPTCHFHRPLSAPATRPTPVTPTPTAPTPTTPGSGPPPASSRTPTIANVQASPRRTEDDRLDTRRGLAALYRAALDHLDDDSRRRRRRS